MIVTSAVLLPLIYDEKNLPSGTDPKEARDLVDKAFNSGWCVRFHTIFQFNGVVYERYIFEKQIITEDNV